MNSYYNDLFVLLNFIYLARSNKLTISIKLKYIIFHRVLYYLIKE